LLGLSDLKDKFKDIIRADASEPRTTYLYATSVTVRLSEFALSSHD
jgi:hypothetical protein